MKTFRGALGLVLLLGFSLPAAAQLFKRDPGDEIPLPDEEEWKLPEPPKAENLVLFDPGFVSPLQFYIDGSALTIGAKDRIVRYTLVVKSDSGASNVSYEGLRCDTAERKIYAYGTPDGKWSKAREPQWKPVHEERYRRTLFHNYFCPRYVPIRNAPEGINAIKDGVHPSVLILD